MRIAESQNNSVGRDLGGLLSNLQPKAGLAVRFSCEIVHGFVQLGLENLQRWRLHNLPKQPVLALDYSNSWETGLSSIDAHKFGGSPPES